ncbi:MAG: D-methionine transport system permease protein [Microbacteriaceae bacterium]|jgi:D-methionine transport system permease protein|nr:D-methionine transport system permease protein [Microbacteriaceae bacterium]
MSGIVHTVTTDWGQMFPLLVENLGLTLYMVVVTLIIGGLLGLVLGILLYTTRRGNILQNVVVFNVLNVVVNIVRPIPFIILIATLGPLTLAVVGTTIGSNAAIFAMIVGATFGIARIVEQNLVTIDPGTIEAARAAGAGPWRIIFTLLVPEALGPLILGYTFVFIAIVDMSAIAGVIGGRGLGDFAIQYGYARFNWEITFAVVVVIVVLVQLVQFLGNWLARKALRR